MRICGKSRPFFTLSLPGSDLTTRRLTFHNPGTISSSLLDIDFLKDAETKLNIPNPHKN
jgi:hypothetical protein